MNDRLIDPPIWLASNDEIVVKIDVGLVVSEIACLADGPLNYLEKLRKNTIKTHCTPQAYQAS